MHAALRPTLAFCLTAISAAGLAGPVAAQAPQTFPYLATVTADDLVRAGADVRFYPFGRVKTGDVVRVVGEKAGWGRVVTVGPTFKDFFGFIRTPSSGTASFRLSLDRNGGSTNAPTDVFAPNLDAAMDPASSWKPTTTLAANRTLRVIETTTVDGEVIHKVALPADAEGWIDLNHLRPATTVEAAAWEAAVAKPAVPTPIARKPEVSEAVTPVVQEPAGRAQLNAAVAIDTATPAAGAPAMTVQKQPATRRPVSPQRRRSRLMLDDLEAAYALLLREPIESAEVGPLRLLYIDLADRSKNSRVISRFARTRAQQLELWAEVQQHRVELGGALERARQTTETAEAARITLAAMDRYEAVGQLDASTIYDGKRLPKLLRIRDEKGRTLAYLEPTDRFDYANMLGHTVGVVGARSDDSGLRVTIIEATRIDVLASPAPVETPVAPAAQEEPAAPESPE